MAFPRWPGDGRLPSAAADTYFIAQALRAGYPIARPDLATPPPFSAREVLQWEMQEERIREAYLSRELVHSRLLLDQHMRHQQEIEAAHRSKPAVRSRHSVIIKQRPVGQGAAREHESIMLMKASGIKSKWTCSICQVFATSEHDLKVHLNGRRHKVKQESLYLNGRRHKVKQESLFCDVCKVRCTSETILDSHLNGKRHKKASVILSAKETCTSKEVIAPLPVKEQKQEVQKSSLNCDVGNLKCYSELMLNEHFNGKKHTRCIKAQDDKPVSAEQTRSQMISNPEMHWMASLLQLRVCSLQMISLLQLSKLERIRAVLQLIVLDRAESLLQLSKPERIRVVLPLIVLSRTESLLQLSKLERIVLDRAESLLQLSKPERIRVVLPLIVLDRTESLLQPLSVGPLSVGR